ncbi:MAG: hypothetical protein RLZZ586_581, partial [Pseudomonadota bacterium]
PVCLTNSSIVIIMHKLSAPCLVSTALIFLLTACGTPQSGFRVVNQSDGMIGVQAIKGAKELEAHELAVKECKKMGRSTAVISEAKTTRNDQFPMIYIYQCVR